jgi:hypothetical protein
LNWRVVMTDATYTKPPPASVFNCPATHHVGSALGTYQKDPSGHEGSPKPASGPIDGIAIITTTTNTTTFIKGPSLLPPPRRPKKGKPVESRGKLCISLSIAYTKRWSSPVSSRPGLCFCLCLWLGPWAIVFCFGLCVS